MGVGETPAARTGPGFHDHRLGGAQGVGATYLFQQVLVSSDEQLLLFNPFGILRKSTKYVHTH